ncbi:MAG: DUF2313 domain-containing protein [Candidatus Pacebacteria bacterium]|nr:DUF2313 domain-containing protein [Candidatus Paceibacterota bacterium]
MYKTDNNKILPAYLPDGKVFEAKNKPGSNTYKFLDALLKSFVLFERNIDDVLKEMNISTTEDLIARWEKEYGIPSSCITVATTLEERRNNIIRKVNMEGVQTIQDFTDLIESFGFETIVRPGYYFNPTYKFYVYVDLSATLNEEIYPFDDNGYPFILLYELSTGIIECIMRRLVPANVDLVFRYVL